jgi:Late competence development protein ComFB
MNADFSSVHNHYERPVFDAVARMANSYPYLDEDALPDVACVALNRLGARYIRHTVDLAFYLTEKERLSMDQTINDAVSFAFEFVQARIAMRARR